MLTKQDVIDVYIALLDREPESDNVVEKHLKKHDNIRTLIKDIKNSYEFKQKFIRKNIPDKIIVYIHIPKTAGTYLRTSWLLNNIKNYWWSDESKIYPNLNNLLKNYEIASSFHLIGGHLNIDTFLQMSIIQPKVFLNVLREPVSRVISFYNYIKFRDLNHPLNRFVKNKTLYELLSSNTNFYKVIYKEQLRYIIANNLDNFSDKDIIIIGKQNKINDFVETVCKVTNLKKIFIGGDTNKGEENYINRIQNEKDFDKAMLILEKITKDESRLYNSIESVKIMKKNDYIKFVNEYKDIV